MRTPAGQGNKRVGLPSVGPACRQRLERALLVVEEHPVLAPGLAYRQQLVATPVPWMERMGDFDELPFTNCRTLDLALNSVRLDRLINEAQVGTGVFDLLGVQAVAKSDQGLLGSVVGQPVETHPQFMTFVIRDNVTW